MNGACNSIFIFALPPGALGRCQKVKCHLISITKSISKIVLPIFVCVLSNERYKTYQTGFLFFCRLGHAPRVGLWGTGGAQWVKKMFFQTWWGGGVKNFSMGICDGAQSTVRSNYVDLNLWILVDDQIDCDIDLIGESF